MKREKLEKAVEKVKTFFKDLWGKIKSKVNPRIVAGTCAIMLVACAVVLNFILFREEGKTVETGKKMAIDLTELKDENGVEGVASVSADAVGNTDDYYAAVSLSRQQARDEAMDVLMEVSANEASDPTAKEAALSDINRIALDIEKEGNIEAMVVAKGFEKCVAVVNGDMASVIVSSDTLTPGETAQISEIVYEAAGIVPANLKIIEKN